MQLRQPHEPLAVLGNEELPGRSFVQELATSDSTVAAYVAPAARLYRIDVETGEVVLLSDSPASRGIPQGPQVVGDDVYWEDWRSNQAVLLRSVDGGPAEVLVEEEGVHHAAMSVDGDQMTWVRAEGRRRDGSFEDAELFTASLGESPLVHRSLGKVGGLSNLYRAGAGQLVYIWDSIEVIDVRSGRRRRYELPEGATVRGSPMWVTEDALMVNVNLHDGDLGGAKIFDLAEFEPVDEPEDALERFAAGRRNAEAAESSTAAAPGHDAVMDEGDGVAAFAGRVAVCSARLDSRAHQRRACVSSRSPAQAQSRRASRRACADSGRSSGRLARQASRSTHPRTHTTRRRASLTAHPGRLTPPPPPSGSFYSSESSSLTTCSGLIAVEYERGGAGGNDPRAGGRAPGGGPGR